MIDWNRNVDGLSALAVSINRSFYRLYKSAERLSSGLAINSAADGPAQLVISEQLRSQIASLNQQIENTSALIGKYEYASANLLEMRHSLNELRSLAVSAANDGLNDEAMMEAFAAEAGSIVETYNNLRLNAVFNGVTLFDGSAGSLADVSELEQLDFSTPEAAESSLAVIESAIGEIDSAQIEIGSTLRNDLESQRAGLEITRQNLIASESQIRDTDYITEYTNFLLEGIRTRAQLAMMSHMFLTHESVLALFE